MLLSWERNPRSVKKTAKQNKTYMSNKPHNQKKKQRNSTSLELYGKQADNVGQFCLYSAGLANVHFINTCCKAAERRKQLSALLRLLFKHTFVSERTQTGCDTTCERRRVKKDPFFDATCLVRPKHPQPSLWRKNPYFLYSIRYMNKV